MQDDLLQHRPGLGASQFGNRRAIGGPGIGKRRAEHQPVERGVFESETDVSSTDRNEQRFRLIDAGHGAQHAVTQSFEAHGGDGGEEIELFGKMIVGRAVADAGAARHLSEREGPVLLLGDQLQRRVDQGATEIAVMIGLGFGGANFFRHGGSVDVDSGYILDISIVYIDGRMSIRRVTAVLIVDKPRREQ